MSNKKIISGSKQAFTLIELLIIVAIIGVLASVIIISLNVARNRAKDNSFKTVVRSVQTGLVSCCITGATLNAYPAFPSTCVGGGNYPDLKNISSVAINTLCQGNGNFSVIINPGSKNKGTIDHAVVTNENVTYCYNASCT